MSRKSPFGCMLFNYFNILFKLLFKGAISPRHIYVSRLKALKGIGLYR